MTQYDPIHQLKLYIAMLGSDANEEQSKNLLDFILREIPANKLDYAKELVEEIGDLYIRITLAL